LWLFIISFLIIHVLCSKADYYITPEKNNFSLLEERFFSDHRANTSTELLLIRFLEKENQKNSFVEQTVKQIGFPRWNKIMTNPSQSITHFQGNNMEDGNI